MAFRITDVLGLGSSSFSTSPRKPGGATPVLTPGVTDKGFTPPPEPIDTGVGVTIPVLPPGGDFLGSRGDCAPGLEWTGQGCSPSKRPPPLTNVPQVTERTMAGISNIGSAAINQGIFGDILTGIGQAVFGGQGTFSGANRGGGLGSPSTGIPTQAFTGCSPGFERNPQGVCIQSGFVGAVERFLPGGQSGTQADVFGQAVVGAMGIPALVPAQHQHLTSHCPPGSILGRDNLCYRKGSIPPNFRKWRPGPKPFLTGGEVKCLRKADRLRKSKGSKRLLRQLGMG